MRLLQSIPNTVGPKGGSVSQWHKLLGWFSPSPDAPQNENLSLIKKQIYMLWSNRIVKLLLGTVWTELTVFIWFCHNFCLGPQLTNWRSSRLATKRLTFRIPSRDQRICSSVHWNVVQRKPMRPANRIDRGENWAVTMWHAWPLCAECIMRP